VSQFKDSEGRPWIITATIHTIGRVKRETDIDLTKDEVITTLGHDLFDLGAVLYSLCQDQAKQRGLDEAQFAAGFNGDVIEPATDCLIEELINFTQPGRRPGLRKMFAKQKEMMATTIAAQNEALDGTLLDDALENEIDRLRGELTQRFGTSSTPAPESSASSRAPLP